MFRRSTPAILGSDGAPYPGSIADLGPVTIAGQQEWLMVRGVDGTAPLILLLHDGPGAAQILLARRFQFELERALIVANWDQPGAGLSSRGVDLGDLTIDRLVSDTIEVSRHLLERYQRDRLILCGHGWGSAVGLLAAARAPQLYEGYIGSSQFVDPTKNDAARREWALSEARTRGVGAAIRELEGLGDPPFTDAIAQERLSEWVREFGGDVHEGRRRWGPRAAFFDLREYTLADLLRYRGAERRSRAALQGALSGLELPSAVRRLEIPAFFVSGRHDHVHDPGLSRDYLRALEAPRKGWAWIEDAAHYAPFEQPDAYAAALAHFAHDARGPKAPNWAIAG